MSLETAVIPRRNENKGYATIWRANTAGLPQVMTSGAKQLVRVTKVHHSSGEDSGTTFGQSLKIVETFVYENNDVCCLQPRDPIEKSQGT